MSSAAHWLVLGAAASREKGGFICMGNGAVNTHASCGHAARSGCTFKGLKSSPPPPSSPELELCCCPSAGHYLPPSSLPLPCFVLSSPLPMSSFLCGRRSSSHFGLPKDGDRGKKKFLLAFSSSVSSAEFVQMSVFFFYEDLMPSESKIKHENQLSYIQRWETGQAPCAA